MPNKPENNRVNQARFILRKIEQGFIRKTYWIKPEWHNHILDLIKRLENGA